MRWQDRQGSENVEDRRGRGSPARGAMVGGSAVMVVIVLLIAVFTGDNRVLQLLQNQGDPQGEVAPGAQREYTPAEEEAARFVSVVLRDTEDVWTDLFAAQGREYQKPRLVLFTERVDSACGMAGSAMGPFYCPADNKVYLDLSFFDEMKTKFQAQGDFAQAYVVAHEVGHHVQNLLGISEQVHAQQGRMSKAEYNDLSVRLELQADYFAGVFSKHANQKWNILEEGDVEEALECARAIGDDRLQMQGQGYVVPDSFTHGTSAQRARWFYRGFESGDMDRWNPFEEENP